MSRISSSLGAYAVDLLQIEGSATASIFEPVEQRMAMDIRRVVTAARIGGAGPDGGSTVPWTLDDIADWVRPVADERGVSHGALTGIVAVAMAIAVLDERARRPS